MWRYHIYNGNHKEVKVSDYIYPTEKAAMEAAAEYVKRSGLVRPGEFWTTTTSHR